MVLDEKSSSSEIDLFVDLILLQNQNNNMIDVTFDFLTSAFDMFNFFIHLLIKSLILLSGQDSIDVDNISLKIVDTIKERFRYTGINILIQISEKIPVIGPRVFIQQKGGDNKLENFSLKINSASNTYTISFSLSHKSKTTCHSRPFII